MFEVIAAPPVGKYSIGADTLSRAIQPKPDLKAWNAKPGGEEDEHSKKHGPDRSMKGVG